MKFAYCKKFFLAPALGYTSSILLEAEDSENGQSACEVDKALVSLDCLEALLNLVATDNKILAAFAESAFQHLETEITRRIIKEFKWLGFLVDDEDGGSNLLGQRTLTLTSVF